MNHSPMMLKIALFFCCSLILPCHWCEAVSSDEYISLDDETFFSALSEVEQCSTSTCEVRIEVLAFKTDVVNVTNFEVTGITSLKNEQFGIKPIVGTQLSYGGKDFNDMDELFEFLKNDPEIEVLGFSKDLYQNDQAVKLFDHSESLKQKLSATSLDDLVKSHEDGIVLENTLYLKQRILNFLEVDLTVSLQKATLKLDSSPQGACVLLSRSSSNLARVPVPHRFFAFLPGLIFEGDYEPSFEGTYAKQENTCTEPGLQRSIVLILRPFIYMNKNT